MAPSTITDPRSRPNDRPLDVREIEQFLYDEAALLDAWKLDDWLSLLTDDVRYLVPSLDMRDADPRNTLFLIADDRVTLKSRVRQLLSGTNWAESPHSRTRRLVSNVRVLGSFGDETHATANFAVWRFHLGQSDVFVGRYMLAMVRGPTGPLIRLRKVELDHETLKGLGKLTIVI